MTTTTELTVVERAAVSLQSTERETALRELVAKSTDLVEIKNAAAREQVHGAAMALRTARTDIEKAGKVARDDANAFSKAVIAEANRLVAITEPEEKRLLALRQAWDDEREAEKEAKRQAEARRVALIREHIEDIRSIAARAVGRPSAAIAVEIQDLEALGITLDRFQELTGEARPRATRRWTSCVSCTRRPWPMRPKRPGWRPSATNWRGSVPSWSSSSARSRKRAPSGNASTVSVARRKTRW
ncbi:hypothetical protein [Burkholderia gladioli]|uniref:hypothetical protein n=1 Tax=Burkholderia gladioli TaxID=28095 RepID=UPI003D2528E8